MTNYIYPAIAFLVCISFSQCKEKEVLDKDDIDQTPITGLDTSCYLNSIYTTQEDVQYAIEYDDNNRIVELRGFSWINIFERYRKVHYTYSVNYDGGQVDKIDRGDKYAKFIYSSNTLPDSVRIYADNKIERHIALQYDNSLLSSITWFNSALNPEERFSCSYEDSNIVKWELETYDTSKGDFRHVALMEDITPDTLNNPTNGNLILQLMFYDPAFLGKNNAINGIVQSVNGKREIFADNIYNQYGFPETIHFKNLPDSSHLNRALLTYVCK